MLWSVCIISSFHLSLANGWKIISTHLSGSLTGNFRSGLTGHRVIAWFFIFLTTTHSFSCGLYRVTQGSIPTLETSIQESTEPQTFIVHSGASVFALDSLIVSPEQLYGEIKPIEQPYYYNEERIKEYVPSEKSIINEVHIYLDSAFVLTPGYTYIPASYIEDIRVIDRDRGKVAGAIVLAILLFLAWRWAVQNTYSID